MALITRMGRSIASSAAGMPRRAMIGAGLAGVGVLGAARGFNQTSGDLNDALYEITTGNPNIDEEVFGMPMSARELLLPFPNFPGPDFQRMRTRARMAMQPKILGRTQAYRNRMPQVSGSMVMGQYNSRGR